MSGGTLSKKKTICVVINNRANYARIKTVIFALQKKKNIKTKIILGASSVLDRYGNLEKVLKKDGIKIFHKLYTIIDGGNPTTMAKSTGLAIIEISSLLNYLKADIVITVADRFETLATAIASSYMNIILAHTQGGEITGSIDESVRHAVTKLSHLHFASSKKAYKNVINLGEKKENVFLTGCPSIDLAKRFNKKISNKLFEKYTGVGKKINLLKKYLVVVQHPVTTEYGGGLKQINQTLKAIKDLNIPTVWLWPNVDAGTDEISKGIRIFREKNQSTKIFFIKNLNPEDYLSLINNCACIIGNSSSAIREGAFLGIPSVNIGSRQNGREIGKNVLHANYNSDNIKKNILKQIKIKKYKKQTIYGNGNSGYKIASILDKINIKKFNIQKKLNFKNNK